MIFSKGKKDYSKYHFFQNNSQIEIVERYTYLGIVFYFNGNLKHKGNNKITELRTILQRESQNS